MSWRHTALFTLYVVLNAACNARESNASSQEPVGIAWGFAFEPTQLEGAVVVNDANLPLTRWGADPWKLAKGCNAPVIVDDALTLSLSYSGDCARHDFTLVANNRFQKPDPVGLLLFLAHDDNGDRCEAYSTDSYRFNLAPFRAIYQQAYGSREGVVRLLLRGPEPSRSVLDLSYAFRASP